MACRNGSSDLLEVLINSGGFVKGKAKGGLRPLHVAAHFGQLICVKQLLSKLETDVEWVTDNEQNTALHLAAAEGHTKIVATLIDAKAQINVQNALGQTPLHKCCVGGHYFAAKRLLDAGCDVKLTDCDGWSPQQVAEFYQFQDLADLIITSRLGQRALKRNLPLPVWRSPYWDRVLEDKLTLQDRKATQDTRRDTYKAFKEDVEDIHNVILIVLLLFIYFFFPLYFSRICLFILLIRSSSNLFPVTDVLIFAQDIKFTKHVKSQGYMSTIFDEARDETLWHYAKPGKVDWEMHEKNRSHPLFPPARTLAVPFLTLCCLAVWLSCWKPGQRPSPYYRLRYTPSSSLRLPGTSCK